jgi:hypothetical protein
VKEFIKAVLRIAVPSIVAVIAFCYMAQIPVDHVAETAGTFLVLGGAIVCAWVGVVELWWGGGY